MKTFISPESWFLIEYPDTWFEFEDEPDAFLFYNPDEWNGNFRISAYRGETGAFGRQCLADELTRQGARRVRVGSWDAVLTTERFSEDGEKFLSVCWTIDVAQTCVECSFTTLDGASIEPAERVLASLQVNPVGKYFPHRIIDVRLMEISAIEDATTKMEALAKKVLKARFGDLQQGLDVLQKLSASSELRRMGREGSVLLGMTLCALVAENVEGFEWRTLVDGRNEQPVLVSAGGDVTNPFTLFNLAKGEVNVQSVFEAVV